MPHYLQLPDIQRRIRTDFGEQNDQANTLLQAAAQRTDYLNHPRILRCIVFLAKGSVDDLRRQIEIAVHDPRDVMMAAEYEQPADKSPIRIRDFNEPFEHNPE